jgi:hypothetical protein
MEASYQSTLPVDSSAFAWWPEPSGYCRKAPMTSGFWHLSIFWKPKTALLQHTHLAFGKVVATSISSIRQNKSTTMSLSAPGGAPPINAETADNYEEIEKQFAVKGAPLRMRQFRT